MSSKSFFKIFPTPRFLKFSYVGFEISGDTVRYAEVVNHDGKGISLGRHGEKKFKSEMDIFTNESLKSVLKEIAKIEKITHIKATLPEESNYLFTIPVQGDDVKAMRNSIEFHLEENVPISGAEALFDFYVLPNQGGEKQAVVSVVSEPIVENYISLFEECGLTPVAFMAESSSLSRSVIKKGDEETSLMVYLSEGKTVFSVVSGGYVQFSSTLGVGGSVMTEALRKYFSVSEEEARAMKKEKGFSKDEDQDLLSALVSAVSVLRDEVQRVVLYWHSHHDKESKFPVKRIILIGSDAAIPGFAEYLSVSLKLPVEIGNVWENFERYKKEVPPLHHAESLSFGACLGLSLTSL
ncbi:MAG TPA: pilus assembly protein PilM [Candidatus Paceibacterota bacterium]|nr:pilus assembly protein PilM [Candidatus Paceibacterota bacterium]